LNGNLNVNLIAFEWHLNGIFISIFSFPTECLTVSSPIFFDDFPAMSKIMDDTKVTPGHGDRVR
jgi:hypothetical protein